MILTTASGSIDPVAWSLTRSDVSCVSSWCAHPVRWSHMLLCASGNDAAAVCSCRILDASDRTSEVASDSDAGPSSRARRALASSCAELWSCLHSMAGG